MDEATYFCMDTIYHSIFITFSIPSFGEYAGILQLMDRLVGTSFFMPSGLVVKEEVLMRVVEKPFTMAALILVFPAHPEIMRFNSPGFWYCY